MVLFDQRLNYRDITQIRVVGCIYKRLGGIRRRHLLLDAGVAIIDTTAPDTLSLIRSKVPIVFMVPEDTFERR